MITSNHRFHGLSSLRFVLKRGETVRGQLFSIKFITNNRIQQFRVAVVVSKKVSKKAVTRNRIRRRLFEIIRSQSINIKKPLDIVIFVYSEDVATISFKKLENQVIKQLKQAGIL